MNSQHEAIHLSIPESDVFDNQIQSEFGSSSLVPFYNEGFTSNEDLCDDEVGFVELVNEVEEVRFLSLWFIVYCYFRP